MGQLPVEEMDYTTIVGCGEDGQRVGGRTGPQDDTWMVPVFSLSLIISSSSTAHH